MKNKILLFVLIVIISLTSLRVKASEESAVDKIMEYEMEEAAATNSDEYVVNGLVPYAGISPTEWIIIILSKSDSEMDFTQYVNAVYKFLEENDNLTATDYERIALCFSVLGIDSDFVTQTIDEQTGKRGIMSIIYGLMISAYGDYESSTSSEDIAKELLTYQLEDGSFSVNGTSGDIDVTAMALQALAPLKESFPDNICNALDFIESHQLEDGGFSSMGIENVESSAQVLLAFISLGMQEEAEKVKQEILTYQNEDGGFAHTKGDISNGIATYQAWEALVAYDLLIEGKPFIYSEKEINTEAGAEPETTAESIQTDSNGISGKQIKGILLTVLICLFIITNIFLIIKKNKKLWKYIVAFAAFAASIAVVFFAKIESKSEHYDYEPKGSVTTYIEIRGYDSEILERHPVMIDEGDTAFSQLNNASKEYKLEINYSGSEMLSNIYIRAINDLAEFDHGTMSGWTFAVNGEYPNVGCSQVELSENDEVIWIYKDGDE